MLHYEIAEMHRAELIREAEEQRLVKEAEAGHRTARRGLRTGERRVSRTDDRFTRAA
ncbi:hypothetical protein [Streptomyces genisteinicus]|uniref:Uncharacterized protein n=1 Tax=Streptomyces genisteinicus TaxID=2768068 RepID=A0A7H0HY43_9ACTN|nr:hypothetical protein [Streptomyces genisteinicus]QNP65459.1 hypothetical protein IAG43_22695 [Streptomyces genisteinicus]